MTANACAPDGGPPDGGTILGCHVEPAAMGPHAVCLPAGTGTSGSTCTGPADCAPGLECVASKGGGMGECRPYCCAGQNVCATTTDDAGSSAFCDIQTAVAAQTSVPVCMPVHSCKLLSDDAHGACATPGTCCASNETCAVVTDDGATSCVAVGTVAAGADCDTEHCAADLVCLGIPGQRRCYQLCLTAGGGGYDCPSGLTCTGGLPLFPDTRVGICSSSP
jgi:hypothetical protein